MAAILGQWESMMTKRFRWGIGVAVSVAMLGIAALGLLHTYWNAREAVRRQEPSLVPSGHPYSPDLKHSATCFVPFQSEYPESRQALVKRIVFTVTDSRPTDGSACSAPADTISVPFTRKDWDGLAKLEYFLVPPQTVKGGETIVFALSLVDAQWVGTTYFGQIEVYYDNKKRTHPDVVRIDVSSPPEKGHKFRRESAGDQRR